MKLDHNNSDKYIKLYHNWLSLVEHLVLRDGQPIDHANFCVDNGGVLGAYGIRDTHDLDFLCYHDDINTNSNELGCVNRPHRLEYNRLGYSIRDIIDNSDNHFYHYGMKFMTLSILKKFKFNRTRIKIATEPAIREKDRNDYELINNFSKETS